MAATKHRNSSSIQEDGGGDDLAQVNSVPDTTYLTGLRLFVVILSVTVVLFLMMLDISILSTVSHIITDPLFITEVNKDGVYSTRACDNFLGHPSNHQRLPPSRGCRLVRRSLLARQVRAHPHFPDSYPRVSKEKRCKAEGKTRRKIKNHHGQLLTLPSPLQRHYPAPHGQDVHTLQHQGNKHLDGHGIFHPDLVAEPRCRQWTFLIFLFIFEAGSAVCASATSSRNLIGGRTVAGIGGSGLLNGGLTIIMGACSEEIRPSKWLLTWRGDPDASAHVAYQFSSLVATGLAMGGK